MHPDHELPEGAVELEGPPAVRLCCFHPSSAVFVAPDGIVYRFKTRAHRKGRYPVRLGGAVALPSHHRLRLLPAWWGYPYGDISYWVGLVFTLGCIAWVVNGHYALWQDGFAAAASKNAAQVVAAVAALVGGTLFEVGSWLLYWEALNPPSDVPLPSTHAPPAVATCPAQTGAAAAAPAHPRSPHPVAATRGIEKQGTEPRTGAGAPCGGAARAPAAVTSKQRQWRWFGVRPHDVGFMASLLQLIGATIFWVPCIFATPGVAKAEDFDNVGAWDGVFWGLQVVGATFFIASSALFMLEEQPTWWQPMPQRIGWHVGFWNLLGAVGFWLSGFFGFWSLQDIMQLGGTNASTFWGSYCFLIGSYLQLLEAVNKHQAVSAYVQLPPGWYRQDKVMGPARVALAASSSVAGRAGMV